MKISAITTPTGWKFYMGGNEVKTLEEAVRIAQEAGMSLQVRLVPQARRAGIWRYAKRLQKLFVKGCAPS